MYTHYWSWLLFWPWCAFQVVVLSSLVIFVAGTMAVQFSDVWTRWKAKRRSRRLKPIDLG